MAYFEALGDYHGERASSRLHERDNERPFTHRDFERAIALIRAALDEITTFRSIGGLSGYSRAAFDHDKGVRDGGCDCHSLFRLFFHHDQRNRQGSDAPRNPC